MTTNERIDTEEKFLEKYGDVVVRVSEQSSIVLYPWSDAASGWHHAYEKELAKYEYSYMDRHPDAMGPSIGDQTRWQYMQTCESTPGWYRPSQYSPMLHVLEKNYLKDLGFIDEKSFWKWREYVRMHGWGMQEYRRVQLNALSTMGVVDRGEDSYLDKIVPFELFPHPSTSNDGMVAFTPNETFGLQDRQLKMRIGKFLRKYATCLNGDNDLIKAIANAYTAKYGALNLHYAEGEEIREIYATYKHNGFNSCMSGEDHFFEGHIHPAAVYNSPDIKMAWLGDKKAKRLDARALINVKEKEYSVVYGNEQLGIMLEAEGYSSGDLLGCRLKYIEEDSNTIIMPYIDGTCEVVEHVDDEGHWMVVSPDGREACRTDGLLYQTNISHCDYCEEEVGEEELTETYVGEMVCEHCLEEYYALAIVNHSGGTNYVSRDFAVYSEYEGEYYHESRIGLDIEYSEYHDDYLPEEDVVYSDAMRDYILIPVAIKVRNPITKEVDWVHEDWDYAADGFKKIA